MLKRLGQWMGGSPSGKSGEKPAKGETSSRKLWDTDFKVVDKDGLDADDVIAYVDEMKALHQAAQDAQEASVRSIVQTAITDAHEIADKIRLKAEKEAEATANNIVAEAQRDAEETKRRAEVDAKLAIDKAATTADKNANLAEAEAQDKAVLFLLRAREQIEREIVGEFNEAYTRLSDAMEALVNQGKELQADLRKRRDEMLKSKVFELTEGDVPLIGTPADIGDIVGKTNDDVEDAADAAASGTETEGANIPEETAADVVETASAKKTSKRAKNAPATAPVELVEEPAAVDEATAVDEDAPTADAEIAAPEAVKAVALGSAVTSSNEVYSDLTDEETQDLYVGEVDIMVPTPVDAMLMSQLHRYLQTTPEIKLVRTAGSMGRGTVVTISIDKPIPLIGALSSRIPDIAVTIERRLAAKAPGLPGAKRKIRIVPKTD